MEYYFVDYDVEGQISIFLMDYLFVETDVEGEISNYFVF